MDRQIVLRSIIERHDKKRYIKTAIKIVLNEGSALTITEIRNRFEQIGVMIPDSNIRRAVSELWKDREVFSTGISGETIFMRL